MSATIHNLDDSRPHLVVTIGEEIHVFPVSLAIQWAENGDLPEESMVRKIIQEWLLFLTGEQGEIVAKANEDNHRIAGHYMSAQAEMHEGRAKIRHLEAQIAALNAKLARVRVAAISLPHPPSCDYHQSDVCTCGKAEILREVGP